MMKFLEEAKSLIAEPEVKEGTKNFLSDSISALLGDPVAAGKIMVSLMESPFFFQEKLFWQKFEMFISGIDMDERERAIFCAKLTEEGRSGDNPYRLLQAINRAETRRKVGFIVNASRSLAAGFIDLTTYFRMCHAITNSVEEDLVFLSEHIQDEGDFGYNDTTQGLLNVGLMRQSVIDVNGDNRFVFTSFADTLDQFAISYNNVERYPMIGGIAHAAERPMGQEIEQLKWKLF